MTTPPRPRNLTHNQPQPTPEQRAALSSRIADGDRLLREQMHEVPTSDLDTAQRQRVWAHLKEHHPERVAFLQDDTLRAFMASTGAVPTFPREIVREALQLQPRSPRHAA